ncbi:DUF305 domain-containing protein [Desertivibrio insolitus]|uniref:DUF305 domain-containing protein n=1 Tax=Herbiconiux sp. SYSU D00978 TaxID=2812562 RepID=UPI001A9680A2|nr:DUF305 domain-containing protein [Herbiconiux sp. SYSU D00978]
MTSAETGSRRVPARLLIAAAIAVVLLLLGGIAIGRVTAATAPPPSNTSAEAGFARDMQTHHRQAVEMSLIVRDNSQNEEVRRLAYDILNTQLHQAGQMYGWLEAWGLPQTASEPSMTWMTRPAADGSTHEHADAEVSHRPGDPMPGYATGAQLTELQQATGTDADRVYLTLMVAHHQGGVEMAQAVLARSDEPVVVDLAESVVSSQTSEIDYMEELLAALPAA